MTRKDIATAKNNFISLEELAHLTALSEGQDWEIELSSTSIDKLKALGLVSEKGITTKGLMIVTEDPEAKVTTQFDWDFGDFWKAYPASDKFGVWPETRKIKSYVKKADARLRYIEAREHASHAEIMLGLTNYIDSMKKNSIRQNAMRFMFSPQRFLTDKVWKDYEYTPVNEYVTIYGADLA